MGKTQVMPVNREDFLQHIADRLGRPRQTTPPARDVRGVPSFYREEPFGEGAVVDKVERFREELSALGGHVDVVDHIGQARHVLQRVVAESQVVVTWHRDVYGGWELDCLWESEKVYSDPAAPDFMDMAKKADIGITTVQYAVANTGTIVLYTTDKQPRSVSLLPAIHVALMKESQIVSRMGEVFEPLQRVRGRELPSSVHFITGPSRSSDIENDLSIGVHGPVAVRAVVVKGV